MLKKQKIIIAISFLLFMVPSISSAGCFGSKPIIDGINFGCIRVSTSVCKTSILLENKCDVSFYYYNAKNCSTLEKPTGGIVSKVSSFLHDDFIEIPPNWRLAYYNKKGPRSICGSTKEGYGSCADIHCDIDSMVSGKNSISFGIDSSRQYTIRGHYGETENPAYIVYIITILVLFLFIIAILIQKNKRN